jgi:RHS repeat-associated protein
MTARVLAFARSLCFISALCSASAQAQIPSSGRFTRGTGPAPSFHSFVVPLDFEKGLALDNVGGNATNLFPGIAWTNTWYHYNATNPASATNRSLRIPYKNPIAAFGSRVGGTPLYTNQPYRLGAYAGLFAGFADDGAFAIRAYYKTNLSAAGTNFIVIPDEDQTNQWNQFASNGYTATVTGFGLTTRASRTFYQRWGVQSHHSYVLTHEADGTATNYVFEVTCLGYEFTNSASFWMTVNDGDVGVDSRLYTLEFEARPPLRPYFIDQVQFDGKPLPSTYVGKTVEELLTLTATITNEIWLTNNSAYKTVDQSPELRRHPALDEFVADLRNDPIALTRFVFNEIGIADPMGHGEQGQVSTDSVNLGGVNRGALATYLERQGSPWEQCALLIYLLRQAGYHAAYVFPTNSNLLMLDTRLSKLMRLQVKGAINQYGVRYTTNSLIIVNYPWVVANIDGRCVHLFPWIKDTEIVEGLDLYSLMPPEYDSGFKWARDYIYGKTNLLALDRETDGPRTLFPKFIEKVLLTNAPGVSIDDIGVRVINRPNSYARWEAFPKPNVLTNAGHVSVLQDLTTATNTFPAFSKIFDTLQVQLFETGETNILLDTGLQRMCDLHNRKFLLLTNSNKLRLWLAPFRPDATNQYSFGVSDPNLLNKQIAEIAVPSATDYTVRIKYQRHRFLTNSLSFLDVTEALSSAADRPFTKGDLTALVFDVGKVSQPMVRVHAEEFWRMERRKQTNSAYVPALEDYQGTAAVVMGMGYYEKLDRFTEVLEGLHKIRTLMTYSCGLAKLTPKSVGGSTKIQPSVDMIVLLAMVGAGNDTTRADSGYDSKSSWEDYYWMHLVNASAEEHLVLNGAFSDTNAISTIKLLHLAQQRTSLGREGIVELTPFNYKKRGDDNSTGYGSKLLKNYDADIWKQATNALTSEQRHYTQVYITPAGISNVTGSFKGMGVLIHGLIGGAAFIGGGLNGGSGSYFPTFSVSPTLDFLPYSLSTRADGSLFFQNNDTTEPLIFESVSTLAVPTFFNSGTTITPTTYQSEMAWQIGSIFDITSPSFSLATYTARDNGFLGTPIITSTESTLVADPVNVFNGEFYIDTVDLSLPGPMPLEVRRNYLSQNRADNQLGYGWKLNLMPFLVRTTNDNGVILFYAAEMDGSVVAYRKTNDVWLPFPQDNLTLSNDRTVGIGSGANMFKARIVQADTNSIETYLLQSPDGGSRRFEVRSYPLNSGTNTLTRERPYLSQWKDHRGNYYQFTFGSDSTRPDYGQVTRIDSSNGSFLLFDYDAYGRIVEAVTGDGRSLLYEYDQYGDLTSVTLPDASEIRYDYQHYKFSPSAGKTNLDSNHLLVQELKPDGRVLKNEYDNQRRVTNQWATVGSDLNLVRNATFIYSNNFVLTNAPTNGVSGYTLVTDVFNRTNRYDYTNGLTTKITDPLNQSIVQAWYFTNDSSGGYQRSLKSRTDRRLLTTTYFYDTNGNVLTNIVSGSDLTGDGQTNAVNTFSYNSNNLPLLITDSRGRQTKAIYADANYPFLPTSIETYASNGVTISTNFLFYTNRTTVLTNGTLVLTNRAFGLPWRHVLAANSPDAATNDIGYDARGFVTNSINYTATADPNVARSYFFNGRGELVEQIDAAQRKTRFDYDGLGRLKWKETIEATGKPLAWEYSYYNPNGELVWSDGPRYDPEDYIWRDYDGAGRVFVEIRWRSQAKADASGIEAVPGYDLYATTYSDYDNFGNLIRVINPRGVVTTNIYDMLDRLISRRVLEADGSVLSSEGFAYEAGGQVAFHTNALGGVTEKLYTATGKPRYQKNPDGQTNSLRYYLDGRVRRETQGNGAYWETAYDDASRRITRTFYSSSGTALATNVAEFDRRGNLVRQIDAAGFASTNRYDGLDRIKVAAGPAIISVTSTNIPSFGGGTSGPQTNITQQITTYFYDASGQVLTVSNALGERTITTSDALGRIIRSEIRNTTNVLIRETTTSYAPDHHSVTVTNGSGSAAVASTIYTDNDGHAVLSVAYPSSGVTDLVWQDYDVAGNRLVSQTLSRTNSTLSVWTINAWTYDSLNRVKTETIRDGATTTFSYNAGGNLTNRAMPGNVIWRASYNNAGQLLQEYEFGTGNLGTRTNSYSYYAANTPYAGLLNTRIDGRGVVCTHTYDDWLRPATNSYSGATNYQNQKTVRAYDARGLLTSITESYSDGTTGPTNKVRQSYDAYGMVLAESVLIDTEVFYFANQSWDAAGRRGSLGLNSFGYAFAWRPDGLLSSTLGHTGGGTYTYDTTGQLLTRTVGARTTTIAQRDGTGRPLAVNTTISGTNTVNETNVWRGDGLLSTHSVKRPDFTDNRDYFYAELSRRLVEERLNLDSGKRWTNTFAYDNGTAGRLGVLTRAGQPHAGGAVWTGGADALARITAETNSVSRRAANGRANGPSRITPFLDGQPMPVSVVGTQALNWRTTLELSPGAHELRVSALHPSGLFTASATNWFTNSPSASDRAEVSYDGQGQITQKIWRKADGTTNRTQTLAWDALGRLYKVTERDAQNDGFDWTPIFDPLGRRLRTTEIPVTNGVSVTAHTITINQYYDPHVEFLEVAVSVNGQTTWKLHGPDLNGVYGGLNGLGGFDAIVPGPHLFCPVLNDSRGNALAVYDQDHGNLMWSPSRPTGFGSVPGYRPPALGHGGNLVHASAWRGRWMDVIGSYQIGLRPYNPEAGHWDAPDSLGHDADPALLTFAGGDPINFWDSDGRLAKGSAGVGPAANPYTAWAQALTAFYRYESETLNPDQQQAVLASAYDRMLTTMVNAARQEVEVNWMRTWHEKTAVDWGMETESRQQQEFSALLDWTPGVNLAKAAWQTTLGFDPVTGGDTSRGWNAAMVGLSLTPALGLTRPGVGGYANFLERSAMSEIGLAGRGAMNVPRVFYVTPRGVAVSSETLAGQGSSHLAGNFEGLAGASVDDVIARIPNGWMWGPQRSGQGIVFSDAAGFERIRIHGSSMNAPAGSNSRMGWTLRVMDRAGNYYDDAGRLVPYHANDGHIPLFGNPNAP